LVKALLMPDYNTLRFSIVANGYGCNGLFPSELQQFARQYREKMVVESVSFLNAKPAWTADDSTHRRRRRFAMVAVDQFRYR
jgi:hypothetical protein